jgi:porphobilinogen synthase
LLPRRERDFGERVADVDQEIRPGHWLAGVYPNRYSRRVRRLVHRPRRLRRSPALRNLVRETNLTAHDFVLPLFVSEKIDKRRPIASMPGVFQFTVDEVVDEARQAQDFGLQAVLLFGIPEKKDEQASGAYAENGVIQKALRAIKSKCPDVVAITDVCLCEYMSHGHCGITRIDGEHFHVLNDQTVDLLVKTALSHARAGADLVAPSDMMDGRIGAIREALDTDGFTDTGIMSYAAKFASVFYGPFRDAAESPPQFGDRRSYQMDTANADEALREVGLDIDEGADIIMIKPALPYIDILWRARERFRKPTAVYHVSGEYAMVKAAAEKGIVDERAAVLEIMTSLKRAGADIIVTYWAHELVKWIGGWPVATAKQRRTVI